MAIPLRWVGSAVIAGEDRQASGCPCITISVCCIIATSVRRPPCSACTSPRTMHSRAAGLDDEALRDEPLALRRREQVELEFDRQHRAVGGKQREPRVAAGRIDDRRDHAGVNVAVLLRDLGPRREFDRAVPGLDRREPAPSVAIAPCRSEARADAVRAVRVGGYECGWRAVAGGGMVADAWRRSCGERQPVAADKLDVRAARGCAIVNSVYVNVNSFRAGPGSARAQSLAARAWPRRAVRRPRRASAGAGIRARAPRSRRAPRRCPRAAAPASRAGRRASAGTSPAAAARCRVAS